MTGRMSPEREAELRAEHYAVPAPFSHNCCAACSHDVGDGFALPADFPCAVVESLDALAAERAHAQQVEVLHSSAAVLGYVVFIPAGHLIIGQKPNDGPYPTLEALRDDVSIDPDDQIAAVVRVGADGRIGS